MPNEGQFKSVHKGSKVDIAVEVAHKFNGITPEGESTHKPIATLEQVSSVKSGLFKGFKLYRKQVDVTRDSTTGALTTTDNIVALKNGTAEVVLISEDEAGDVGNITKALREDYTATNHITLTDSVNQLSKYSTKHIVGEDAENINGVTLISSDGSKTFRYVGSIEVDGTTKYMYVAVGTLLPKYFTEEADRSKVSSLGVYVQFNTTGSQSITDVTDNYIVVGGAQYARDANNDLVFNELDSTTYPNYFAWTNAGTTIYTSTMAPTTESTAVSITSWTTLGTTNVKRDTFTQGAVLKKGIVDNEDDTTKFEELKDGIEATSKTVGSLAKTKELGDITKLLTTAKENLVEAINELEERVRVFTSSYDPLKDAKEGDVWITTN